MMAPHSDIHYWLALRRAPEVGDKTFGEIVAAYPNLKDFFTLDNTTYKALGASSRLIRYLKTPDWEGVELDLNWAQKNKKHHILMLTHPHYPLLLRQTAYPPPVLFLKGEIESLNLTQLSIVGSRTPTPAGKDVTYQLAKALGEQGFTITSGLACGIDTCAHLGALESSQTIAVVGTGLNLCYPKQNRSLAEKISEEGALISEFSYNTPPLAHNFPRRNRIISGLSLGTLVVEANINSGSLITARYALDQGREIFAVPGSIHNPRAKGCHFLLKRGAKLVETIDDILEEFPSLSMKPLLINHKITPTRTKGLDDNHMKLLECIDYTLTNIDILIERSGYSVAKITSLLMDLELSGVIDSTASGYRRLS